MDGHDALLECCVLVYTDLKEIIYFLCGTILGIKFALLFGIYYTSVQILGSVWFILNEMQRCMYNVTTDCYLK